MVRNRRQSLCVVDGQKSTCGKGLVRIRPSYHERGVHLRDNKHRIAPLAICYADECARRIIGGNTLGRHASSRALASLTAREPVEVFRSPSTSRGQTDVSSAPMLLISAAIPGCALSLQAFAFAGGGSALYLRCVLTLVTNAVPFVAGTDHHCGAPQTLLLRLALLVGLR